jgi:hypothetical protein
MRGDEKAAALRRNNDLDSIAIDVTGVQGAEGRRCRG